MNKSHTFAPWMVADLEKSGISIETAQTYGMFPAANGSGYYIPYRFWDSNKAMFGDDGKPFGRTKTQSGNPKYRQLPGSGIRPYVIPEAGEHYYTNHKAPLYLIEGEKKAIAATIHRFPVIGLGGIWNWIDKKDKRHGKRLHYTIEKWIKGRSKVIMIFDSDGVNKDDFSKCAQYLAAALIPYSVDLYVAYVPAIFQTSKTGIDDWLVANNFDALRLKQIIDDTAKKIRCTDPWNIDIPADIKTQGISESKYRLLYAISKCAKEDGKYSVWCKVSKERLGAAAGISRRHVIRLKEALIDAGYLLENQDKKKLLKTTEKARSILRKDIETVAPESSIMSESVTSQNVTVYPENKNITASVFPSKCDKKNDVTQYMEGGQKEKINTGVCLEQNTKSLSCDSKPDKTYAYCNRCQQDQPIKMKPESERTKDYNTWCRCEVCGGDSLSFFVQEDLFTPSPFHNP